MVKCRFSKQYVVLHNVGGMTLISDISFGDLTKNEIYIRYSCKHRFYLIKKISKSNRKNWESVTLPTLRMTAYDFEKWHFITAYQVEKCSFFHFFWPGLYFKSNKDNCVYKSSAANLTILDKIRTGNSYIMLI